MPTAQNKQSNLPSGAIELLRFGTLLSAAVIIGFQLVRWLPFSLGPLMRFVYPGLSLLSAAGIALLAIGAFQLLPARVGSQSHTVLNIAAICLAVDALINLLIGLKGLAGLRFPIPFAYSLMRILATAGLISLFASFELHRTGELNSPPFAIFVGCILLAAWGFSITSLVGLRGFFGLKIIVVRIAYLAAYALLYIQHLTPAAIGAQMQSAPPPSNTPSNNTPPPSGNIPPPPQ